MTTFVSAAVSDGLGASSGTHSYAPEEPSGPVTVSELGVRFETEDQNWVGVSTQDDHNF